MAGAAAGVFAERRDAHTVLCTPRRGAQYFAWWRSHLRRESTAVSATTPAPASALFVELAQADKPVDAVSANWDVELKLGSGVFLRLRGGAC